MGKTDSSAASSTKTTALLDAIANDDVKAVRKLVSAGADVCAVDRSDRTWGRNSQRGVSALHFAFTRDVSREVAEAVLAAPKIDLDVAALDGRRPLHVLLTFGRGKDRLELTEKLLARDADPNAADAQGRTPIFALTSFFKLDGEQELFDILVRAGADLAHRTAQGSTLLDAAFERIQSLHQINDKAGMVRVLAHIRAAGAPSKTFKLKEIDAWLADGGARYLKPAAKGPKAPKSVAAKPKPKEAAKEGAIAKFRKVTGGKLGALAMKRTYLELEGNERPVALFDWFALVEQADDDENTFVDQIHEYHVPKHAAAHVKAGRWIPFGVVGMTGALDSYEELRTEGTLFLDLSAASERDAPIVHTSRNDKRSTAAIAKAKKATYTSLMKSLVKKRG